jgi:hypothetical protein
MSAPARLPVCDDAAFTPAAVVPALNTTTGFLVVACCAAVMKSSPEPMLSR